MRGLKRNILKCNFMSAAVASFTDAWIETSYLKSKEYETVSHLLQMRGLKLTPLSVKNGLRLSRIFYRCVD